MKVCPTCNQSYTDDSLNFCLNDGAVLLSQNPNPAQLQQTMAMNPGRQTNVNSPFQGQNTNPVNWNNASQQLVTQPPKKSSALLWVLGIFGIIVLGCGGLAGIVAIFGDDDNTNKNTKVVSNNSGNSNAVVVNTNRNSPPPPADVVKDDLSGWKLSNENFGKTDFQNGELYMTSRPGFSFALVASNKDFRTDNARAGITARNSNGKPANLGYGLLIHNTPGVALVQDYAFLIDSVGQRYRVSRHQSQKETAVIDWTKSDAIKGGAQENVLEVKDDNGKMSFFINGKLVTTVNDSVGIKSGVVGLFVNDNIPIAFSNLQIGK